MEFTLNDTEATRRRAWVFLVLDVDGKSPALDEAGGQPQISKNGAAYADTANLLVSLGNGNYYVELTQAEVDTEGMVYLYYKSVLTATFSLPAFVRPPATNTGAGLNGGTVFVKRLDNNAPIPGVQVVIRNVAETSIVAWGVTDANGLVFLSLNPGTYHVLLRSTVHYEPLAAQELVVAGAFNPTYALEPQQPAPPPLLAGFCIVHLSAVNLQGYPVQGVEARFQLLVSSAAEVDGDRFIVFADITARTDADGDLVDPVTGEKGVMILRSDSVLPHDIAATKKWRIECGAARLTNGAAFEDVIEQDTLILGVVLPA